MSNKSTKIPLEFLRQQIKKAEGQPNLSLADFISPDQDYIGAFSVTIQGIEKYIKKGTKLFVEGSLQTRKWTGNDGVEKYTTEIVLQGFNNKLEIIDNRDKSNTSKNYEGRSYSEPNGIEGDIPF